MMIKKFIFLGPLVHSLSFSQLEFKKLAAVFVDSKGLIEKIEDCEENGENQEEEHKKFISGIYNGYSPDYSIVEAKKYQFLIPGLIDTHTHAPQTLNAGLGLDLPLLDWLTTYTFPQESKFKDLKYAKTVYPAFVRRLIANGTTTCAYFGTIHLDACKELVDIVFQLGQRGYVGKVNMDTNSPHILIEDTDRSIQDTIAFIEYVKAKNSTLVTPIITPRFAPSCTSRLLHKLSDIAKELKLPIQSHIGENSAEIEWVRSLFPNSSSYAGVYDDHGLLTAHTIMAHCIYLTKEEVDLFKMRHVGVSHCPASNFGLSSGTCPVRDLVDSGLKVGLGTDVSGGYSSSMLDAIRQALTCSKTVHIQNRDKKALSIAETFFMATLGSASLLGIDDKIGSFQVGKEFDALLACLPQFHEQIGHDSLETVDFNDHAKALHSHLEYSNSNIDLWDIDTLETMFERFLYLGDDRNIEKVWVRGSLIKSNRL